MRTIIMLWRAARVLGWLLLLPATAAGLSPAEIEKLVGKDARELRVVVEWGFQKGTERLVFDGRIEGTFQGAVGEVQPLPGDNATRMTGPASWESPAKDQGRRGIVAQLYRAVAKAPHEKTAITVWTQSGSFTFQPDDLDNGPILAPEFGFFVAKAEAQTTAAAFTQELAARGLKTIRQRVRERPEQTCAAALRAMNGAALPPYPKPPADLEPAMKVEVPDEELTAAWRLGAWHLIRRCPRVKTEPEIREALGNPGGVDLAGMGWRAEGVWQTFADHHPEGRYVVGCHPFVPLAMETHMILRALDQAGMRQVSRDGLAWWLELQRLDGKLTLQTWMDDLHAWGPGAILWAMAEHYDLTGDTPWLKAAAPQMNACVAWMARERRKSIEGVKPDESAAGKRPRNHGILGAMPMGDVSRDGCISYTIDAYYYLGMRRTAEVLADIQPDLAKSIQTEADAYRRDLLAAVETSLALSPLIQVQDGTYRTIIPFSWRVRGSAVLTGHGHDFGHGGPYWVETGPGSTHLIEPCDVLPLSDPRVEGQLDLQEDVFLVRNPSLSRRIKDYDPEKDWFEKAGWYYQCAYEMTPDIHLRKDDIPNFLRSWLNKYAVDVSPGEGYTFREHTIQEGGDKSHEEAAFLIRFRNLLVMEEGPRLWLAKGTPRAWLEQDRKISVNNAPTHFGTLAYEIVSDVNQGKIQATVELPSRKTPQSVLLRLRHPQAAPIASVMVNGTEWHDFDAGRELVRLSNVSGRITVVARY